jgi:hypothetical protein
VGVDAVEAVLVHDPTLLLAPRGAPPVEDEPLLHAHQHAVAAIADLAVLAGGLPVASRRGAVGAQDRRVLAVVEAVQVPLLPIFAFTLGARRAGLGHGRRWLQGTGARKQSEEKIRLIRGGEDKVGSRVKIKKI